MAERTLELKLIAQDRMTAVFAKAERRLVSFGNKATVVGKKMTALGKSMTLKLTAPIVGLGVATLKVAGDFEFGMKKVAALSGATGDEFEALEKQAKDLGRTTMFSARQVTEAMGFMAMAGFESNEILGATPKLLQLAAAGNVDLATAADITTNILTGYNLEVEQLGAANDVLAKTFTSTNTNLLQLGDAFKFVGPIAAGMEIPFQDTAAAIGLLGGAGIQGSMAGTTLRGVLARLTQAVTPAGEALNSTGEEIRELGLNFFTSEGKVKTFTNIVKELEDKGVSAAKIMQIFGLRAGPGMVALVGQGSEAMKELVTELDNAGGTADKIAKKQMEGLRGQMLKLKSAFEGLAIAIADSGLLEFATNLAQRLTGLATKLAESNPRLLMMGTVVLGVVAAIGPLLIALGFAAQGLGAFSVAATFASGIVLTKFIPALIVLAGKLGLVTVAANGSSLAVTGVGKALALLTSFIVGWKIGEFLASKFEFVRKIGVLAGASIQGTFLTIKFIGQSVATILVTAWNKVINIIREVSIKLVDATAGAIVALESIGLVAEGTTFKLVQISNEMQKNIKQAKTFGEALTEPLKEFDEEIEKVIEGINEMWDKPIESAADGGVEMATEFVTNATDTLEQELPPASDAISDQISGIGEQLGLDMGDGFGGMEVGSLMMDDLGQGLIESAPALAKVAEVALQPVRDAFATFGAELKETKITVPTETFNAAVAGIIRSVGPTVGGVGAPVMTAQQMDALQQAQRASLGIFGDGGIATKPTAGIFGERGPEALIPLDRAGGFGKREVNNFTINFNGPVTGDKNQARLFAKDLVDAIDEERNRF